MALIECQECRMPISSRAVSCPRCGCPAVSVHAESSTAVIPHPDELKGNGTLTFELLKESALWHGGINMEYVDGEFVFHDMEGRLPDVFLDALTSLQNKPIHSVSLEGASIDDIHVEHATRLQGLRTIRCAWTVRLTSHSIYLIGNCKKLSVVDFGNDLSVGMTPSDIGLLINVVPRLRELRLHSRGWWELKGELGEIEEILMVFRHMNPRLKVAMGESD